MKNQSASKSWFLRAQNLLPIYSYFNTKCSLCENEEQHCCSRILYNSLDRSHPPRNVEGRYVQWVHKEYADSGRLQWECFSGLNDFTWSDHLNVCTDVTNLYEGKLLLAGVVVSGGPLVLLGVVGALFIGVLVCGMYQFPGILQEELGRGRITLTFINTNISAGITHHAFSPHHFHNMSAPLWQQLHALQGQVKQLPVLSVSLLGFLTPWPGHHLHQHKNKRHLRLNPHNPDFLTVQISAEKKKISINLNTNKNGPPRIYLSCPYHSCVQCISDPQVS